MAKSNLRGVSDTELEQELARRKAEADAARAIPPVTLPNPDFTGLREMIVNGIEFFAENGYDSKDFQHYVYEEALTAVYGQNFWKWRNARMR